ncbi:hypothetical protein rpr22_0231 [Rickettsia prowazekii str. Rp22]|uniref:Uncharacterized protein n=1 Tax=Rickettsia prowazekii (strain Rp22) TaxID=449216 RepID=D5AWE3_RICPP|nr:hypothetical protein rpr22_0231 [Rickettsia prowazekii str. Rp22]AGJ02157.1 Threonine--tRNA ligase [Rickettsia prowazekii str. NMRC Madrid E]AGJ02625.1 hypothetical protein H375_3990 [Rickettsia prowazekii str. Breinl]EOB10745.1 hypothetical protein H376_810 [Rickettsia prowazekii str. GvF12]EOB11065.1 Threonine--tRNA ligase [Rickettsia prowazekii str. Cairo 3]
MSLIAIINTESDEIIFYSLDDQQSGLENLSLVENMIFSN